MGNQYAALGYEAVEREGSQRQINKYYNLKEGVVGGTSKECGRGVERERGNRGDYSNHAWR